MHLPGIRWVSTSQPGLQDGTSVAATTTGNCGVDDLSGRVVGLELVEQGIQGGGLSAGCPPEKTSATATLGCRLFFSGNWRLRRWRGRGWASAGSQQHAGQ
jgi:hypothetical protein